MRDKIISNVIRKMGSRLPKKDLNFLEIILCEELQGIKIEKESTEVAIHSNNLSRLKDMYLATLAVENKSMQTIAQYNLHLTQFADYFKTKSVQEIDATDIRSFLFNYKRHRGISDVSLNNKRCALSSFFTWLTNEEYICKDPTRRVKKIKTEKIKKKAYTAKELEQMRMQCQNIRDRALIEMLTCTGCRVSELCKIDIHDIDFSKKEITVSGKGNKERVVFISDKAALYLDLYLKSRKDGNVALFVAKRYPHKRIKKDGIERIVRNLGEKCGIHAHPHKFRRTFCTNLINRGMPAQDVAILMGHSDVNTTCNVYYDANTDRLKYKYDKYTA